VTIRNTCAAICLAIVVTYAAAASAAPGATGSTHRPHEGDEPDEVEFFIYVLDVDEISGQDQSFTVNVSLILRWTDERLAHDGEAPVKLPVEEVWTPDVILANRQASLRMPMPEIVEVRPDGSVRYRQQYVGPLSQRLMLKKFPLDVQDFSIHFASPGSTPEDIKFVPATPEGHVIAGGGMAEELSLPDWQVLSYKAETRPYQATKAQQIAGFAFEFIARRHFGYYFWQAIVPLILIVMMSWVPFWVHPSKAELQFGIASSAVLTLIAYRFTLASLLPKLPYLTRLDLISTGGTILVFMAFLQVLITSLLAKDERVPLAERIDRCCRFAFPIIFAALVVLSLFA
jgi:hypothetical protein